MVGTLRKAEQSADFESLAPGKAFAVQLDVTDRKQIRAAFTEAISKLGGLDILVNNAGYGMFGAIEELDEGQIDDVMQTNFFGTLNMIRAALPSMRTTGGKIVNFSSLAGLVGVAGLGSYCAAKFAVEGLSESLVNELAPFNIHVMLVEPGAFRTEFAGSRRSQRSPDHIPARAAASC